MVPSTPTAAVVRAPAVDAPRGAPAVVARAIGAFERIPQSLVAALARFSIAGVFWNSGQTKVTGFAIDLVEGRFMLGWPQLSDTAVALFQDEYKLPLLAPVVAAPIAAFAEHLLPLLLLLGLGTRFAALGLLGMTAVIQVFVYPGAWPTHGTWAALLLYLVTTGPGAISVDRWIAQRRGRRSA